MTTALILLLPFARRSQSDKIIFSVTIEFSNEYIRELGTLQRGGTYQLSNKTNEIVHLEASEIEQLITNAIEQDLKKVINEILDLDVSFKVTLIQDGSIEVWFTAALAGYYGISKYKNFVESCDLIRKQCKKIIDKIIKKKFGSNPLKIEVQNEIPKSQAFWESRIEQVPIRDGLFYFLLIGFLVLLGVLSIFVYHAFKATYFGK